MKDIRELMVELDGADAETVNRIAWETGSLPVRLAMLGLASIKKGESPLWWGYPPGVFISYKWAGPQMKEYVVDLAKYLRQLGYRAFLDVENLDENADAYFQIPQFIASLQDCTFYILLLTEQSADFITARKHKTTWIFDEYQHAVRLCNSGRLFIVPVLLEPKGATDVFNLSNVIDFTSDRYKFDLLEKVLYPNPVTLSQDENKELESVVRMFDTMFLNEKWEESDSLLQGTQRFKHTFDHQFRCMLHSLYTADKPAFDAAYANLRKEYGEQILSHVYKGYCEQNQIPNRIQ